MDEFDEYPHNDGEHSDNYTELLAIIKDWTTEDWANWMIANMKVGRTDLNRRVYLAAINNQTTLRRVTAQREQGK